MRAKNRLSEKGDWDPRGEVAVGATSLKVQRDLQSNSTYCDVLEVKQVMLT